MKSTAYPRFCRAVSAALAAVSLLAAALLIWQCLDVYLSGVSAVNRTATGVLLRDIYSRDIVGERLARIGWVFWLWLALLVLASAARLPASAQTKSAPSPENCLAVCKARVTLTPAMEAEEKRRRTVDRVCAAVCAVCAAAVLLSLCSPGRFASRELESVMGALLLHTTPWIAAAFTALFLRARIVGKSLLREINAAKGAPRRKPEPQTASKSTLCALGRAALYVAAVLMILAGIANGGMFDVLVKAINICTECIGLG